jgi:hypothetical protein
MLSGVNIAMFLVSSCVDETSAVFDTAIDLYGTAKEKGVVVLISKFVTSHRLAGLRSTSQARTGTDFWVLTCDLRLVFEGSIFRRVCQWN